MKPTIFTLLACLVPLFPAGAGDSPQPSPRIGINLSAISDSASEYPFVDLFKCSREWISQCEGREWGKGPALDIDGHGWVTRLSAEPGACADSPMNTDLAGHSPLGAYTIVYDGAGKLSPVLGTTRVLSDNPGRLEIDVGGDGSFFLRLEKTDPANPVRNIRVLLPGFGEPGPGKLFHPVFLNRWKGMACIRFMDWMHTNGSTQTRWQDRPEVDDASYATRGVPVEVMVDLCNRLGADPWFCMPHLADDEYVRNFAAVVKERLDPRLKAHIEYSNECWNISFAQTGWLWRQAQEKGVGPADRPWEGGAELYVRRSLEIFKIWASVFGGTERLVRIVAWQAETTPDWTDDKLLAHTKGAEDLDALAIAPYVAFNVPPSSENPEEPVASAVGGWTVDQVMDHVENVSLPRAIRWMQTQKAIADKYGVKLMAYEGGQHLVGIGGAEGNAGLQKVFREANLSGRMGDVYRKYYDAWADAGGDLLCCYSSVSRWGGYGNWGLAEYAGSKPSDYPKYQATLEWAKSKGQPVAPDPWAASRQ